MMISKLCWTPSGPAHLRVEPQGDLELKNYQEQKVL
jgi:hypothetical protein